MAPAMRRLLVLAALALAPACATSPSRAGHASQRAALAFVEDDYPKALALAKERGVPLFVDTWAPWCHSCLFLREHVLTRPELARHQGRYVFLAVDTEKERNTGFLEQYPVEAWPTLFIIDSASGAVALKWLGTATVAQLEKLLDDGERAVKAGGGTDAAGLLKEADALYGAGKPAEAAALYEKAVASSDAAWDRRPRAVESWLAALAGSKQVEACARVAQAQVPGLPPGPSFLNASVWGLGCALEADAKEPWRAGAVQALEALGRRALEFPDVLADDRSGLYETLVGAREDAKDEAGQKALGLAWLDFLEAEAARAPTPAARAAFDPHRVSAALAAGAPARAEAALLQSEREFPDDYNPPARLLLVYRELGRLEDALAAGDRALARAYGPRKLRLFLNKAEVLGKKGDVAAQRALLKEGIAYGRALPAAQRAGKAVARLEAALKKLDGP